MDQFTLGSDLHLDDHLHPFFKNQKFFTGIQHKWKESNKLLPPWLGFASRCLLQISIKVGSFTNPREYMGWETLQRVFINTQLG